MADEWYFMKSGRKIGPLSSKTIVDLAASGKLLPTDSIQKKGAAAWQEASAVKGLFPKAPAPATAVNEDDGFAEELPDATDEGEDLPLAPPPSIPPQPSPKDKGALSAPKYKYLDWYIASSRSIARIVFALFAIAGLTPFIFGVMSANAKGIGYGALMTLLTLPIAAIIGYLIYMIQMAGADFLSAVRDIEENTRSRTA